MTVEIKQHDRQPPLTTRLEAPPGVPIDLTLCTVRLYMVNAKTGARKINAPVDIVGDPADGRISYAWGPTDTDTAGLFKAEFEVTYSDGTTFTIPQKDYLYVNVVADLGPVEAFDYVLVGLGTSGALLASLLAAAGYSVLAVEAGQDTRNDPDVKDVSGDNPTDGRADLNWLYEAAAAPFVPFAPLMPFKMGLTWSGSSGHDYGLNVWPTAGVMDVEWASIHSRWGFTHLLPARKWAETFIAYVGRTPSAERGTSGGMFVSQGLTGLPEVSGSNSYVVAAAAKLGTTRVDDYNDSAHRFGLGELQQYVDPNGGMPVRSSSATAFLQGVTTDAAGDGHGANLTIRSGARALNILWDGATTSATGVRYFQAGQIRDVFATREVLVCAGTMESPAILQRSGVGPRSLLEGLGIPVRVANDNVGSNVQNHFGFGAGINLSPGGGRDDVPVACAFMQIASSGMRDFQLLIAGAVNVWNLRPPASGTVQIKSKDPFINPRIDFGWTDQTPYMAKMVAALKLVADAQWQYCGELTTSPPASAYPASEYGPMSPGGDRGGAAPDDSQLVDFIINGTFPLNHNSGSCRMAASAADGVVDGDCRVFGTTKLRIIDNSSIRQIGDGNTRSTAILAALGAAEAILGAQNVPWATR